MYLAITILCCVLFTLYPNMGLAGSTVKLDDTTFHLDAIEDGHMYMITADAFAEKHDRLRNVRSLGKGLQHLAITYKIVSAVPLTSTYYDTNPTSALLVFVEKK